MRVRTAAAAGVLFSAVLTFGVAGTASAATDLDCSDFATQAEAQAEFNRVPGDPHRLDADSDGIACETLAGGTAGAAEDGTSFSQVSTRPAGAVAAGDGSADDSSALPYVLGGAALTAAGGAAFAARRSSRASV
jgi:hypothetical protein